MTINKMKTFDKIHLSMMIKYKEKTEPYITVVDNIQYQCLFV